MLHDDLGNKHILAIEQIILPNGWRRLWHSKPMDVA
jgi:hypothetical protein